MTNSVEQNVDASWTRTTMSNPPSNPPRRRLSSRRGSLSAVDPYGVNGEVETARATASRITIVRVPQEPQPQPKPRERDAARRSSWGSNASSGSNGRAPGRLSFAFTSFNQNTGPPSPGRSGSTPQIPNPPSPGGYSRSSSHHSLDRAGYPGGRPPHLTPQQICDIAVNAISHSTSPNPQEETSTAPSTFLLLPDEQYLPFLDRPSEVTSLLTSPPTSRLMALLSQTFPAELRNPYDPVHPPESLGTDPSRWSFAELSKWLQTTSREDADDRLWVLKARACVLTRSELIWSRLKSALGVPPELEEDEYDDYDEDDTVPVDYDDEPEAFLEPILPGDTATCVASPLATPDNPFGHGGRDGVMESIGESAETEADQEDSSESSNKEFEQTIQGLRISTTMQQVLPRSRPISPAVSTRRSLSTNSAEDTAETRRRDALAVTGTGRVRRSAQQERGTGDPLFPSSFATLTMGPSLVAKYVSSLFSSVCHDLDVCSHLPVNVTSPPLLPL